MKCKFCDRDIEPHARGTHRLIQGWERNRTAGEGVHPIKDRVYLQEYAHDLCLEAHLHGTKLIVKQDSLL